MRYAEESEDPLTIAAAAWTLGQAILADDMPQGALDVSMTAAEKLEGLLPDGTPEQFSVYGGLIQCAAIAATRLGDPWRSRELLRGSARLAAERVGNGRDYHHMYFGPTNVGIHVVNIEFEAGEIAEALRLLMTWILPRSHPRSERSRICTTWPGAVTAGTMTLPYSCT